MKERSTIPHILSRYSIYEALGVPTDTREIRCLHPEKHSHGDETPSATIHDDRIYCHVCKSGENSIGVYASRNGIDYAKAVADLEISLGLVKLQPREVATYQYRRADGSLAYEVCRFEPGWDGKKKGFRQRRIIDGSTVWGLAAGLYKQSPDGSWYAPKPGKPPGDRRLPATERVPFRLPELLAAPKDAWVLIPEGEKDVLGLVALGFVATCNSEGAGKWLAGFGKLLAGCKVAILPDNDEPGRKHALSIKSSIPTPSRIVELPGLPEKGDVTDWIKARRAAGLEDSAIAAELVAIIEAVPAQAPEAPAPATTEESPITDLGIADRFVARHGDDVRYCLASRRWFIWNGSVWRHDTTGEALDRMAAVAREETTRAADEPADLGAAKKQESASRIAGALTLAGINRRVAIAPDAVDSDPWLLSVRNGTIDLRTGTLRPHAKADMITRCINLDFDPKATCPRFLRFLDEIMPASGGPAQGPPGDSEMITLLRRWFGYCLTADTTEHVIMFFTGTGRNGKGALIRAVKNVLGPMSGTAPDGLLTVSRFERHPAELEVLRNRRLIIASELPKTCVFNEARMKQLTGGDEVAARGMRENFSDLVPTAKILIQANHKPRVSDDSPAFWERMRIVPFPVSFVGREDRGLDDALRAEASGILAWMVAGCVEWRKERLPRVRKVEEATAAYRQNEDSMSRFIEWYRGEIGRTRIVEVPASTLLESFNEWAEGEGAEEITATALGKSLKERGWSQARKRPNSGGKLYRVWSEPVCDTFQVVTGLSVDAIYARAPALARASHDMEPLPTEPVTTWNVSQGKLPHEQANAPKGNPFARAEELAAAKGISLEELIVRIGWRMSDVETRTDEQFHEDLDRWEAANP